jgi:hypothetical protein
MGTRVLPKFQELPSSPRCQCSSSCKRVPLKGEPWCEYHKCESKSSVKKCKCFFGPVNGSEPKLDLDLWNNSENLTESHNCYTYAINMIDPKLIKDCDDEPDCNVGFPQPGYESGYKKWIDQKDKGCADLVSRLWGDNPNIKATRFESKCPSGTSKIALIIDPKRDYHFLRQDPDGYWSHKPGALSVRRTDASDRPIIRPDRGLFLYKAKNDPLMYSRFCGYFCVPRGKKLHMSKNATRGGHKSRQGGGQLYRAPTRYLQTRRRSRDERRQ